MDCFYHAAPVSDLPPTHQYRIERSGDGRWAGTAPGQPLYRAATPAEVFAFLEWRATADLLTMPPAAGAFLHAAGVALSGGMVLLLGPPGAGKSTIAAHLFAKGYPVLGDDLVRFAAQRRDFEAVPRSFKLDSKSLSDIELLRQACEQQVVGTLLAPDSWYVSPAAVRTAWAAQPGRPAAVVVLAAEHDGPARLERMSAAQAAIHATETLLGGAGAARDGGLATLVLESLADVKAWSGSGAGAAALARAIEELDLE